MKDQSVHHDRHRRRRCTQRRGGGEPEVAAFVVQPDHAVARHHLGVYHLAIGRRRHFARREAEHVHQKPMGCLEVPVHENRDPSLHLIVPHHVLQYVQKIRRWIPVAVHRRQRSRQTRPKALPLLQLPLDLAQMSAEQRVEAGVRLVQRFPNLVE